jgi:hypothetical protein
MDWLRRLWAGLRHDLTRRNADDVDGYRPAFDPTLPKRSASYGPGLGDQPDES